MATIQAAQTASLLSLLALDNNKTTPASAAGSRHASRAPSPGPQTAGPVWKILVLDDVSKDVLATVLRVQDLRDVGVTLHVFVCILAALSI